MVHNIPALAAIRFILGVVEAAVMPAMLIYISNWFTKSERSRANTFLILGNPVTVLWMSVVSGYLIQAFGWREMFIIEGVPAVIWAFCWWVLVKDKPSQVNWLAESEKAALQEQLDREQQGIKAVRNYGEAFRSRNVILLCMQYLPGASACTVSFCGCRRLSAAAAKIWGWWKWLALIGPLSGGDHRDDRGLLGLR
jgi:MFS family permease